VTARIAEALKRRVKADRGFTDELRRFRGQYLQFAETVVAMTAGA